MKFSACLFFACVFLRTIAIGQAANYDVDAALRYNKLLIEKRENRTIRVGAYRVVGSPYLFGENGNRGTIFTNAGSISNVGINYNVYEDRIERFIENSDQFLAIETASIDSFWLNMDSSAEKSHPAMHFVNAIQISPKEKGFLQVLMRGKRYAVYKKYTCAMGLVTENYSEADLRQFNLSFQYYFQEGENTELKKIKATDTAIKKAFAGKTACIKYLPALDNFISFADKEQEMLIFFQQLDDCH